ncbi:MAG TPA: sulfate ABC transporter substrate-binding protein [Gemmataceae bacterium]|nr:sulfate ABC transporter substrate-binding protein [Gemmataceae bacterium]
MNRRQFLTSASAAGLLGLSGCGGEQVDFELLNVSYDPTRELYRKINRLFAADYFARTGKKVRVRQSHGGSGSQARAVMDGLPADVVTLAMWTDTDAIRAKGFIEPKWEDRFPNKSLPYYSTIVFVVRKGNPHGIQDWPDLIKPGVKIITPNPKTSGGAKFNILGAWGAVTRRGGSEDDARGFVRELLRRVPVLDSGARSATVTFARKNIGDVHLTWENEAHLEERELKGELEVITPKISVMAEPHVAVVDANAARRGTAEVAKEYLEYLYTPDAQAVVAESHYRTGPPSPTLFRPTALTWGGKPADWPTLHKQFFAEGGLFDQVYQPGG